MREDLGRRDARHAHAPHRELIEHARLGIGADQPLHRQQRGEQGRGPDHPSADPCEQHRVRPDRKGEQDRDEQEERDHQRGAAPGIAAPHIAGDQRNHSATVTAPGSATGR